MSEPQAASGPPDQRVGWFLHDAAIGGGAGTVVGFIAGLFALRLVESIAVPFTLAAVGALVGAVLLVRAGRDRNGITASRLLAWVLFGAGAGFLYLLYQALENFT